MKGPGEQCWLYWDSPDLADEGDYLRTQTGRTYLIDRVRVQQKGKHAGRQHLLCTVMPADHVTEPGAVVRTIIWYDRSRSAGVR